MEYHNYDSDSNVVQMFPPPERVRHVIRLGHNQHTWLEKTHAAGRILLDMMVVDAAHLERQLEVVRTMQADGTGIILDSNSAELASSGHRPSEKLPWAKADRPWVPSDFGKENRQQYCAKLADYAVENQVGVVLAPCHVLREGALDEFLPVDLRLCEELRTALDSGGGKKIALDYPLMLPYRFFRDAATRTALLQKLKQLPFGSLWLRIDGFGSDQSPQGLRKYISYARAFHELEKPVVGDCVGGLVGLGIAAFGACGGIAHGIAQKERFNTYSWWKPRSKGGGSKRRVYLNAIDQFVDANVARTLLEVRGAKSLLGCIDRSCCAKGLDDFLERPNEHFIIQRGRQIADLSKTPETRRAEHFVRTHLEPAERKARQAARLGVKDEKLSRKLTKNAHRLDDMRRVLEDLHATLPIEDRSPSPSWKTTGVHEIERAR